MPPFPPLAVVGQPIVDLVDGSILGYEALLRVRQVGGILGLPGPLFSAAEQEGRGAELEATCQRMAIAWAREWLSAGTLLWVNLNGAHLDAAVPERLTGWPRDRIVLELNETYPWAQAERTRAYVSVWRELGFLLALDDYGSGLSTPGVLVAIRPDFVKIDRSLVAGIASREPAQVVVRAILDEAADLGARVVAEGIETQADLAMLQALGVPLGQGFLLAKPEASPAPLRSPLPVPRGRAAARVGDGAVAWWQAIVEASSVPALVVSRRRHVEVWNEAARELLGWNRDQVLGRQCFLDPIRQRPAPPEGGEVEAACPLVEAMVRRRLVVRQISVAVADGSYTTVVALVIPLPDPEDARRVVGALETLWPGTPTPRP